MSLLAAAEVVDLGLGGLALVLLLGPRCAAFIRRMRRRGAMGAP